MHVMIFNNTWNSQPRYPYKNAFFLPSPSPLILQHGLGEISHGLSYTQITQNFLSTTQDRIELVISGKVLNNLTHTSLRQATAAKDVDRLVSDLVRGTGGAHFEQGNRTAEMLGLLFVRHVAHLISDAL